MSKLLTGQNSFTYLVANVDGAGDPSRNLNPVKLRQLFRQQHFMEIGRPGALSKAFSASRPGLHMTSGLVKYTTSPVPVECEATVTVVDNDFTTKATLFIGDYTVTSAEDFTPGGSTAATATALAAAIDALPLLTATALGSVVTVLGPVGLMGNTASLQASYKGLVKNYTLDPVDGFCAQAEPQYGPPEIE